MKKTLFILFAMIWTVSIYSQDEAALDSIALAEVVVSSGVIDVLKSVKHQLQLVLLLLEKFTKVGNMEFQKL